MELLALTRGLSGSTLERFPSLLAGLYPNHIHWLVLVLINH